ncbi:hypothetical protein LSTR_LSTR010051 [Laodelphax striatellus]|uniref:Uncharacterized protein n=1 Tax=Laodelphax striatellus TaxID=195883 RepID=A0A482WN38_LAOST|nr:hypothetical protein LSTR_LSTR010051 [Laodelphax striatellus]
MDHLRASSWNICHNEDGLQQALKLLKEELYVLGYPAIHSDPTDSSRVALVIDLINSSWSLTREVMRHRTDKIDKQHNQSNQLQRYEHSQKELTKLQNKIDTLEKQNKTLHNDLQAAIICKAAAEKGSALARANVDKMKKILEFNSNQYSINLKKKEMELRSMQNAFENYSKTGKRDNEKRCKENDPNRSNANENQQMELVEKSHRKISSHLKEVMDIGLPDVLFQLSCEEMKEAMDSYFGSPVQNIDTTLNEVFEARLQ